MSPSGDSQGEKVGDKSKRSPYKKLEDLNRNDVLDASIRNMMTDGRYSDEEIEFVFQVKEALQARQFDRITLADFEREVYSYIELGNDTSLSPQQCANMDLDAHGIFYTSRCKRILIQGGICKIGDLIQWNEKQLRSLRGCGITSIYKFKEALLDMDLALGMKLTVQTSKAFPNTFEAYKIRKAS